MNLQDEQRSAGPDERLRMIEEAVSLRIMAKMLRAKSKELQTKNMAVVREAEDATRRSLRVLDILEPEW